jgi:MYXO-CTERM domain-containing protein
VGDQHSPSAYGDLVGYVDGADGEAAWLYDSAAGTFARVCDGVATSVSVGSDGTETFVAVARSTSAHDEDVEVWAAGGGAAPLAALRVPGVQRNPHLSGPWVAFEDVSTRFSQVVLWNWKTGLVFVPHPSTTDQVLNDLSLVVGEEVRVVFEDSASAATGRDIALYVLELAPLVDDGLPDGYPFEQPPPPPEPARCDGAAEPIATLHLGRATGAPLADEVPFRFDVPAGAAALPVLVCIDAQRVSSAWVTLDDEAIARPSDFAPSVVHLEVRGEVQGGAGKISGVIAGKPGAALDVRVLAEPARLAQPSPAGKGEPAAAGAAIAGAASGGCASGPAGAGALLGLALLLARRRPRRG